MSSNQEIWRRALTLLEGYGARAEYEAAAQLDATASLGDAAGETLWIQVMSAVHELQRPRRPGECLH